MPVGGEKVKSRLSYWSHASHHHHHNIRELWWMVWCSAKGHLVLVLVEERYKTRLLSFVSRLPKTIICTQHYYIHTPATTIIQWVVASLLLARVQQCSEFRSSGEARLSPLCCSMSFLSKWSRPQENGLLLLSIVRYLNYIYWNPLRDDEME